MPEEEPYPQHPQQVLDRFCQQHLQPVCTQGRVSCEHSGHLLAQEEAQVLPVAPPAAGGLCSEGLQAAVQAGGDPESAGAGPQDTTALGPAGVQAISVEAAAAQGAQALPGQGGSASGSRAQIPAGDLRRHSPESAEEAGPGEPVHRPGAPAQCLAAPAPPEPLQSPKAPRSPSRSVPVSPTTTWALTT